MDVGGKYRPSYLRILCWVMAFGIIGSSLLLAPLAALLYLRTGSSFSAWSYIVALSGALVVGGVLVALVVLIFQTSIYQGGIEAYTFWGLRRSIAWTQMTDARPFNLIGLRFVRVSSVTGTILWVPMFHSDQNGFVSMVRALAPDGSPLCAAMGLTSASS
jgi:hypothetical protein